MATPSPDLQHRLADTLNAVPTGVGLIAIAARDDRPFLVQAHRGVTDREIQALLRSSSEAALRRPMNSSACAGHADRPDVAHDSPFKLRMNAPAPRWFVGLRFRTAQRQQQGVLFIGRKTGVPIMKKEQALLRKMRDQIAVAIDQAGEREGDLQNKENHHEDPRQRIEVTIRDLQSVIQFDQGSIAQYVPETQSLAVLRTFTPDGIIENSVDALPLDASASGWVVRHKKPRIDQNLASTQGRFLDQRPLYKAKYQSTLVIPLRNHSEIVGTLSLASKTPRHYSHDHVSTLEHIARRLAATLIEAEHQMPTPEPAHPTTPAPASVELSREESLDTLRTMLTSEIRRPLASIQSTLGHLARGKGLSDDTVAVVGRVTEQVNRIEIVLGQLLEYGKPVRLTRTPCQLPALLDESIAWVRDDLARKQLAVEQGFKHSPVTYRCDPAKMKIALVGILKHAIEMAGEGGTLHLQRIAQRNGMLVTLEFQRGSTERLPATNLPAAHSTAQAGESGGKTWVTLPAAKTIIEEHRGRVSIAFGPLQKTTIIISLPITPSRARRGRRRTPTSK